MSRVIARSSGHRTAVAPQGKPCLALASASSNRLLGKRTPVASARQGFADASRPRRTPTVPSGHLEDSDAGRIILIHRGDLGGPGPSLVVDLEGPFHSAGHPHTDEAIVIGLSCLIDEHLTGISGERDVHLSVVELAEAGGEAMGVAVVGLSGAPPRTDLALPSRTTNAHRAERRGLAIRTTTVRHRMAPDRHSVLKDGPECRRGPRTTFWNGMREVVRDSRTSQSSQQPGQTNRYWMPSTWPWRDLDE